MLRIKIIQELDWWGTEVSCLNIEKFLDKKRFHVERERRTNLYADPKDARFDVVFLYCSWHDEEFKKWYPIRYARKFKQKYPQAKTKLVVGVRGDAGLEHILKDNRIGSFDGVNTSRRDILEKAKKHIKHAYLCEAGVDTEFFKPQPRRGDTQFTVGWAGNYNNQDKNGRLVSSLGFHYKIATRKRWVDPKQHRRYYHHLNMPSFYAQIDVLVLLSESEGCPLPPMEAAACGLPIVASDVGQVRELIGREWIVKASPRTDEGLNLFKTKIGALANLPKARRDVGLGNRRRAVERWDWRKIIKQYEKFFESMGGLC